MKERPRIKVTATPRYLPDQSDPNNKCYVFSYNILIKNLGPVAAKLLSRHWIITDADGQVQEVKGAGVVGEQPHLKPGESFEYSSSAVIPTPVGTMQGEYYLITDEGTSFSTEIPIFSLATPNILN